MQLVENFAQATFAPQRISWRKGAEYRHVGKHDEPFAKARRRRRLPDMCCCESSASENWSTVAGSWWSLRGFVAPLSPMGYISPVVACDHCGSWFTNYSSCDCVPHDCPVCGAF